MPLCFLANKSFHQMLGHTAHSPRLHLATWMSDFVEMEQGMGHLIPVDVFLMELWHFWLALPGSKQRIVVQ